MKATTTPNRRGPPPTLTIPETLRRLAFRVERLALGGRTDPEQTAIERELICQELRRLAREAAT